jgi:hypothetical protein
MLDQIFGENEFINEIIWKRQSAHSDAKQGAKHLGRVTIRFSSTPGVATISSSISTGPTTTIISRSPINTSSRKRDEDFRLEI